MRSMFILAGGLISLLAGCASAPDTAFYPPVGPASTRAAPPTADGTLQVYSARVERFPGDLRTDIWLQEMGPPDRVARTFPAHTDYTIYRADGQRWGKVQNSRNLDDPQAARVTLPPGNYRIRAEASGFGIVDVPVVIAPGERTTIYLDGTRAPPEASPNAVVQRSDGRVVGWRAELSQGEEMP